MLCLQVDQLREAIEELYYFEFVLDDVPIWGFVGYMEESGFLPHTHKVCCVNVFVSASLTFSPSYSISLVNGNLWFGSFLPRKHFMLLVTGHRAGIDICCINNIIMKEFILRWWCLCSNSSYTQACNAETPQNFRQM